jgi:hypothetical protein
MEIVEDSEPERVHLRNQSRETKNDAGQLGRTATGIHKLHSAPFHTTATVIEISGGYNVLSSLGG